jgi:two-component system phosphate regulon sensor histidine kinase PhoR
VDNIKDVMSSNQDFEREIQTTDKRWFQINILPYIIKKQNITNGVVITFIDITERISDKEDIERINADHETFIYSVSHDFRGPLTNMVLLIDLLKNAVHNDDKKNITVFLEKIEGSARSLKMMINELTDITKIGTELTDLRASVNVEEILEEVKFTLKNQIYHSHAKITSSILVPELLFSRKNLRSILYNLLSNAIKYTTPDRTPEVFFKTEKAGEYILLSVKDNGVGIEEDKQKEIFSKFTRLLPNVEGMGVGLFIVNKMVCNQGGKIEVKSKLNIGTTFVIYLKC